MPNKIAGLSLVELMVASGIVGILAMVALPRFYSFIAQARRGEAKSPLAHIVPLQSVYKLDHWQYYYGEPMTDMNGIGYRDGRGRTGQPNCAADENLDQGLCNTLGFRPAAVAELRYLYRLAEGGELAVAGAASDADGRWIYPECRGAGELECGENSGDVVTMNVNGNLKVCRNITKYCPPGGAVAPLPTINPGGDSTTCDTATECCPDGPTGAAVTSCTRGGGWSFDAGAAPARCCVCNTVCDPATEYRGSDCACHPITIIDPIRCNTATQCFPDGPSGAPQTTCNREGDGWELDVTAADCCACSLTASSCEKGEWLAEECECRPCGNCPYTKVHTTRGSCECGCPPNAEQNACTSVGATWGASCDCSAIKPNFTWSKVGDCSYSCFCNVAVVQQACAASGQNADLDACGCIAGPPQCDPSTECCEGNRQTVPTDCGSGEVLLPYPTCCDTINDPSLNILTVRTGCVLTTVHSLRPDGDSGNDWDGLRDRCGSSLGTLSTIATANNLASECAMNHGAVKSMYSCIKTTADSGTQVNKQVRDRATQLMNDIHAEGCNITNNFEAIEWEPNKCEFHIPSRP